MASKKAESDLKFSYPVAIEGQFAFLCDSVR